MKNIIRKAERMTRASRSKKSYQVKKKIRKIRKRFTKKVVHEIVLEGRSKTWGSGVWHSCGNKGREEH